MEFPRIENIQPTLIADQITPVQPAPEPPVKRRYKDHMGSHVTEYVSGGRSIHSYENTHLYGDYGHAFALGYFIVDENNEMVYLSQDREGYEAITKRCISFWKIHRELNLKFPGYRIEMSRNERLAVNDKLIEGVKFSPAAFSENLSDEDLQTEIEFIADVIQKDIEKGRIKFGEYGAE